MSSPNIFAEDWQACLHAHYLHVLREDDMNNEASLRLVLMQVGFDEEALHGMRAEIQADAPTASMEVADVEPVMESVSEATAEDVAVEDVSAVPDITAALGLDAADAVLDEVEPESETPDAEEPPAPPREDAKPSQLSLF